MAPVMICGSCKTAFRGKDALVAVQRYSRWAHAGTVCRIREIYPKVPRLLNENRKLSSALARTATWVKESPLASVGKKTSSPSRPGSVRLGDNVTKIIDSPASPDPSLSDPCFRGDTVLVASSTLDCPRSRSSRSQEGDAFNPMMADRASSPLPPAGFLHSLAVRELSSVMLWVLGLPNLPSEDCFLAEVMKCFTHCGIEDAKEMYANARALFERPSTVATPLVQKVIPDVSSGRRSRLSKAAPSNLSSPGYAPASVITISSDRARRIATPTSSEGPSPRYATHRRVCPIILPPRTSETQ